MRLIKTLYIKVPLKNRANEQCTKENSSFKKLGCLTITQFNS